MIYKIGILASHPIQYQIPLFRALAEKMDIHVFFSHKSSQQEQAEAGFGVPFEWDINLLDGYPHTFLQNRARTPGVNRFFDSDTPGIIDHIKQNRFDVFIVSGWYLKSYWQAIRACHRFGIPVLVRGDSQLNTPRTGFMKMIKKIIYRFLTRQFNGYLIVGQRAKEYLLYYGAKEELMFSAPHIVDNEWFKEKSSMSGEERHAFRTSLDIDDNVILLLFVGKFIPVKRPLDIVKASAFLNRRGVNTQIIYVGAGELESDIRNLAEKTGVRVYFPGFKNQTEIPQYYAASDLLILPSESETWGLVVNEAMACGLPAVVSDRVGCWPDMIVSGKTGAVYKVGDAAELAKTIEYMLPVLGSEEMKKNIGKKMNEYSLKTAVKGILQAVDALKRDSKVSL